MLAILFFGVGGKVSDNQVSVCVFVYGRVWIVFDHCRVYRKWEGGGLVPLSKPLALAKVDCHFHLGCSSCSEPHVELRGSVFVYWTYVCMQETRVNRTTTPPCGPSPAITFNPTGSTTPRRQPRRALRIHTHTPAIPRKRTLWGLCLKTGRWPTLRTERSTL